MSDTSKPGEKELFSDSELCQKVGMDESEDILRGDSSTSNKETQEAALKIPETDLRSSLPDDHHGDWKSKKDSVLHAAEDVHCTILEGEAVLLNLDNGHYYSLNKVGTAIWEYSDGNRTLQAILEYICDRFEVEEGRAQADLLAISSHLVKEKLLLKSEV